MTSDALIRRYAKGDAKRREILEAALRVIAERGISVPKDLSLLFYEDSPWFEWQRPAISVVDSGAADMANPAVDRLMSRLGGVANSGREYRIGSRLVERASCRALPNT